ncbi:MAG TPA: trehalase-like domain-containing protein, partial [Acetobacteraceae bacterium]
MAAGQESSPQGSSQPSGSPEQDPRRRPKSDATLRQARIEDYALIGDCRTAALVQRNGSIDWLCWPRFDSPACFAALLGTAQNGHWRIGPAAAEVKVERRYRGDTLVLETVFETATGKAALIDFMVPDGAALIRIVEGRSGTVA